MTVELVQFRLIRMECCGHLYCSVNPRFPSYCPSCGKLVYPDIKRWVILSDNAAELHHNMEEKG